MTKPLEIDVFPNATPIKSGSDDATDAAVTVGAEQALCRNVALQKRAMEVYLQSWIPKGLLVSFPCSFEEIVFDGEYERYSWTRPLPWIPLFLECLRYFNSILCFHANQAYG